MPENICKTCDLKLVPSRHPFSQTCRAIAVFPNATIAEFGMINSTSTNTGSDTSNSSSIVHQIKAEIFARGPVAASINGKALHSYHGGVIRDQNASKETTHAVEIIGWEEDPKTKRQAWICRNSWGTLFSV
jgi:hypothetical protein